MAPLSSEIVTGGVVIMSVIMLLKALGDAYVKFTGTKTPVPVDHLHQKLSGQVDLLTKWHAPDTNGEQTWKNARLASAITDLSESIDRQTVALHAMMEELRDMKRTMSNCSSNKG